MRQAKAIAPLIFSTVLFSALFTRRSVAKAPPWGPPAPSNLPPPPPGAFPLPSPLPGGVPPDPGWPSPPLPPQMAPIAAGRRYEVTADLLPAPGMGLLSAARAFMAAPQFVQRFEEMKLVKYYDIERPGVGEVTRIIFRVTPVVSDSFPIDHEIQIAGAGSVWLVSVTDVTPGGTPK